MTRGLNTASLLALTMFVSLGATSALAQYTSLHEATPEQLAAIADAKRQLAAKPTDLDALGRLAYLQAIASQDDDALKTVAKCLARDSKRPDFYLTKGLALLHQGERKNDKSLCAAAATAFEKGLAINGKTADGWNMLAEAYDRQGKFDLAVKTYNRALGLDSRNMGSLFGKGVSFASSNQQDSAIATFELARTIDPTNAELANNLAVSYGMEKRHQEAVGVLEEVVRQKPEYTSAWMNLAVAYDELQRLEDADRCAKEYLRRTPIDAPDRSQAEGYEDDIHKRLKGGK